MDTWSLIQYQMANPGNSDAKKFLINYENPEESYLIGAIEGNFDQNFYDPMPFNNTFDDVLFDVPAVTAQELEVIKEWIRLGTPFSKYSTTREKK